MSDDLNEHEEATFENRLSMHLQAALMALSEEDADARVAYCKAHGVHGVDAHDEGETVRFDWGGAELVRLHKSELLPE